MLANKQKKNLNLRYTRLIHFRVSRVSGAHPAALRQSPHIKVAAVASRWQRRFDRFGILTPYLPHQKRTS